MTFIGVVIVLIVIIAVSYWVERHRTRGISIFLTETKDILDNPGKVDPEKYWQEEAKARGFEDVEEFKKIRESEWHEKFLQELMKDKGLTREEAETVECLPLNFCSYDKEAKRRGLSFLKVKKLRWDDVAKIFPKKYCKMGGPYEHERWAEQFRIEKTLPSDIVAHLNQCTSCNVSFRMAVKIPAALCAVDALIDQEKREVFNEIQAFGIKSVPEIRAEKLGLTVEELEKRDHEWSILRFGGKDCFTLKERIEYARMGRLPMERFAHTTTCLPCLRMVEADHKDFLQTGKIGGLAAKALEEDRKVKNNPVPSVA